MKDTKLAAVTYDFFMGVLEPLLIKKWRSELWKKVKPPHILEAGSGTGLNIPFYEASYKITALDSNESFLEKARQRARHSPAKIQFVAGDVQNLPFSTSIFDSAVTTFLFCQLSEPLKGLEELHRVLKPGGKLLLLEHVRPSGRMEKTVSALSEPLYRIFGDNIARDTTAMVETAGFANVKSRAIFFSFVKIIEAEKEQPEAPKNCSI